MYKSVVVGLGKIGLLYDDYSNRPYPSTHCHAYLENRKFDLYCVIDVDSKKEGIIHKIKDNCLFYDSIGKAVSYGALKDIDVVSVCTPPETHLDVIECLVTYGIGKIIFCEKPIVSDKSELRRLRELMYRLKINDIILIPNISRRWNRKIVKLAEIFKYKKYGSLDRVEIRYTRGIYNTGSHMFDLLYMWTGERIKKVLSISETQTSSLPEKSYSFYFYTDSYEGCAVAFDDRKYYVFEMDLYFTSGKIELRDSGDKLLFYSVGKHHLFSEQKELILEKFEDRILEDSCIGNAVKNIGGILEGIDEPRCSVKNAVYPLCVADAIEKSHKKNVAEVVDYGELCYFGGQSR